MSTGRRTAIAALGMGAAVLLGGCTREAGDALPEAETPPALGFSVSESRAGTGDTVRMVLRNESDEELGYNLCFSGLERRDGRRWEPVRRAPEEMACTAELRILRPGGSAQADQEIHPFHEPGVYRFRTRVEWPLGSEPMALASSGFRIVDGSERPDV